MIVEIGTCDFETQAGRADGLFIEPIKYYFDRLPPCRKENVAVSNYTGEIDIYHVAPEDIAAHGLSDWLRGCNSVGRPHAQHAALPPAIVRVSRVPVVRIKSLLDKHAITEIDRLKMDTEGHDARNGAAFNIEVDMDRFALEQAIINCWNTSDDLELLAETVLDSESSPDHLHGVLTGLAQLNAMRCKKAFDIFEKLIETGDIS